MTFPSENGQVFLQSKTVPEPNMTTTTPMASPRPTSIDVKNVNEIWKNNFAINNNNTAGLCGRTKLLDLDDVKTSWASVNNNNNNQVVQTDLNDKSKNDIVENGHTQDDSDNSNSNGSNNSKRILVVEVENEQEGSENVEVASPSHHARRPMNAFLIFCKKHRPIVREQFPTLENRGVTRILGEWWSLLDSKDKTPYTELAKEYKDAFFTANPDFKWYKLPAPPLRTLPTRPAKVEHSPPVSPMTINSSPIHNPNSNQNTNSMTPGTFATLPSSGDFTPGKLADESQLGMLSSLFTANSYTKATEPENLNNNNKVYNTDTVSNLAVNPLPTSPQTPATNQEAAGEPPKPLKKRSNPDLSLESRKDLRSHLEVDPVDGVDLKQELLGAVDDAAINGRKSYRKGKGNRYADIMANGKLIKNKRTSTDKLPVMEFASNLNLSQCNNQLGAPSNKLELTSTIKKLQERLSTNSNSNHPSNPSSNSKFNNDMVEALVTTSTMTDVNTDTTIVNVTTTTTPQQIISQSNGNMTSTATSNANQITSLTTSPTSLITETPASTTTSDAFQDHGIQRIRTISEISEISDVADYSKAIPSFDLDARIVRLPNLSYDTYVQRKKEMKKRKLPKGNSKAAKHPKKQPPDHTQHQNQNQKQSHIQYRAQGHLTSKKRTYDNAHLEELNGVICRGGEAQKEKQTGSKKRKNKNNITHLTSNIASSSIVVSAFETDMSGLATLAEVASIVPNLSNNNTNVVNLNTA